MTTQPSTSFTEQVRADALAPIQAFYDGLADIDADQLAELDVCSLVEDLGAVLGAGAGVTAAPDPLRLAVEALADEWQASFDRWVGVSDGPRVAVLQVHANRLLRILAETEVTR